MNYPMIAGDHRLYLTSHVLRQHVLADMLLYQPMIAGDHRLQLSSHVLADMLQFPAWPAAPALEMVAECCLLNQ